MKVWITIGLLATLALFYAFLWFPHWTGITTLAKVVFVVNAVNLYILAWKENV